MSLGMSVTCVQCPEGPEGTLDPLEFRVCVSTPIWVLEMNSGPLEEEQALYPPPLQPWGSCLRDKPDKVLCWEPTHREQAQET